MREIIIGSLLLISAFKVHCQKDDWIRVFWEYKTVYGFDLIETYDKGYLIDATIRPDDGGGAEIWTWLIKTDINGEILWDKKIGDGIHVGGFHDVHQTEDGGLLLAGGTTLLDQQHGDTFFMKLNACGEKEWCRIFHMAGTTTLFDYGMDLFPVPGENSYIALVSTWGDDFGPGVFKGIWLFKLDSQGNAIWMKNVFDEVHPEAWNELPLDMYITQDETLIITANTLFNDFGGPAGHEKPFICAADLDGTEKWWTIYGGDSNYIGEVYRSAGDFNGNSVTAGWCDSLNAGIGYYPSILKTDKNGNQVFAKAAIDSTETARAECITIMNDSTYDIAGGWMYSDQIDWAAIARTDTNGNLLMEKKVWQTIFILKCSAKTFDNKELFVGPFQDDDGYIKIHLFKFNSNLEYDTLYTQPFEYDYKCDNLPIVSDTIGIDDCDIWTGFPQEEEFLESKHLETYPNPAYSTLIVKLPVFTADEHPWGPMTSRQFNFRY